MAMDDATVTIAAVGRTLYGQRWQTEMAHALGVSDRTVRRWAAGSEFPRPGVFADLARICRERADALEEMEVKCLQVSK